MWSQPSLEVKNHDTRVQNIHNQTHQNPKFKVQIWKQNHNYTKTILRQHRTPKPISPIIAKKHKLSKIITCQCHPARTTPSTDEFIATFLKTRLKPDPAKCSLSLTKRGFRLYYQDLEQSFGLLIIYYLCFYIVKFTDYTFCIP